MNRIAFILAILSLAPPALAGNLYCAAPVKYAAKSYVAPVYAKSNYVEKVVHYPQQSVNVYNVLPDSLIKAGQTHYSYAKIGAYSGFDANLAIERLNRSLDTAAASVPALGQLVAQTISQADAQKHNLYLHQSESASVVAELRELKEVVRELRAGRQSSTTAVAGAEGGFPDGALAVQAVGVQRCITCHQKYATPENLTIDDFDAAIKAINSGKMPLKADKVTPDPLDEDGKAATIRGLFGASE